MHYGEADLHGVRLTCLEEWLLANGVVRLSERCNMVRLTCMEEWLLASGVVRLSEWCATMRLTTWRSGCF